MITSLGCTIITFVPLFTSPDAIHWTSRGRTGLCGDNSNFYYNPFDRRWYYSLCTNGIRGRQRSYRAHADFVTGSRWTDADLHLLAVADDIERLTSSSRKGAAA